MHYLIRDHLRKKGVFNKSNLGNLKGQVQTISSFRSNYYSERLCTVIATDILSMGKWKFIACDQPIEMPYVICEKLKTDISLLNKTTHHVIRESHECRSDEVLYAFQDQHKCLSLKRKCLAADLMDDMLFRDHIDIGSDNYLGKWAMGLTFTIGYIHTNETHGLCLSEIQKWRYQRRTHWEKGSIIMFVETNTILALCYEH